MKKLLFLILLAAIFVISCKGGGDAVMTSGNEENIETTDNSAEETMTSVKLELFDSEKNSLYHIVRSEEAPQTVVKVCSELLRTFKQTGANVSITTDWERNEVFDHEIIIGSTNREKTAGYTVDRELIGNNGYIIQAVGDKIFITGGSDTSTVAAVEYFTGLIPQDGGFYMDKDYLYTYSEDAFIKSLKYNGVSLSEYTIYYPENDNLCKLGAEYLRNCMFRYAGCILDLSTGTPGKYCIEVSTDNSNTFRLSADGGKITLAGSTRTGICRGIRDLFDDIAGEMSGDVVIKEGQKYVKDYGQVVTYEDFGAKGDGKTDDTSALKKAHDEANAKRLPVFAKEDATYYIGGKANVITVRTDTDWSTANFIIDDTDIEKYNTETFRIDRDKQSVSLPSLKKLNKNDKNIGMKLACDCLVTIVDKNTKQFIRYGSNANSGNSMQDTILVHADGTIDESTPLIWDFDNISSATAYPIDETPLSLKGGTITTIANPGQKFDYVYRGIRIYRSNTVVDGLTHYITGEGAKGAPYYGILIYHSCYNSYAENITFTGHKTYKNANGVNTGTYDITVTDCLGFHISDSRQTNDICNTTYWGVFASNTSKNIEFDNCEFSRFDAHRGVCGLTLRNCTFGHQNMNLIGNGTALIENCTSRGSYFLNLRSDYGSTWNGDIIIRNCTFIPKNGEASDAVVINGSYTDTHYFGYTCYMPQNIIIDGLYIDDSNAKNKSSVPYLFANVLKTCTSDKYSAPCEPIRTKKISISNVTTASGKQLQICSNKYIFINSEIVYE